MLVLRSFASVLAGLAVVVLLSVATDLLMHRTGIIPDGPMWNPWHNALALLYRCAIQVLGGWVTARLAPRNPVRHAVILGFIGTAAALAGLIEMGGTYGPIWYPVALTVSALPTCWLGGWLRTRRA